MPVARSRSARSNARGAATRARLLDTAVELLRERGYAGLSISALCERAGVAPTAVYWHFGSKAGLMEAVIGRISGHYVERIRADAEAASGPSEKLDRMIAGIRSLVTTQPLGSLTGVAVVGEGRHVTPELRRALRRAREREFEVIASAFASEIRGDGAIGETLAVLALACTNYAALSYRMDRDVAEVDRILAGLRDAIERLAEGRDAVATVPPRAPGSPTH